MKKRDAESIKIEMKNRRWLLVKYTIWIFVAFSMVGFSWLVFYPEIHVWWTCIAFLPIFLFIQNKMKKNFKCPNCGEKLFDFDGFDIFAKKCSKCHVELR